MTTCKAIQRGAVCLVLGLVTTVAVAWGLTLIQPEAKGTAIYTEYGPFAGPNGLIGWVIASELRWPGGKMRTIPGVEPTYSLRASELDPESATLSITAFGDGWGRDYEAVVKSMNQSGASTVLERASGWPRSALWSENEQLGVGQARVGGIPLPAAWGGQGGPANLFMTKALPVRPLWGGLDIDTVLFAFIWALPLFGWPVLQTRRRVKRGRCPRCAYDLAGAAWCSECGWNRTEPVASIDA